MQRIALLYGGTSSEREVSLRSGAAIADALEAIGHSVTRIDLTSDTLAGIDLSRHTFAFIALHGGWGEGGGVQAELEAMGMPFSGSDAVASALALDKLLTKGLFLRQRVPTPRHEEATAETARRVFERMARTVGLPLVVKASTQGSSIGVSIVRDMAQADVAIADSLKYDERIVIEQAIVGRELTCAIIGARAYPVVEVMPSREFYDYDAKYSDPGTRYNPTPDLTPVQESLARHYAKRAHNALRCHGYSRVDMIMDAAGEFHVLEVNTLPGMTNRSLLPLATKSVGMSYEETLQAMIDASLSPRRKIPEELRSSLRRPAAMAA